VHKITYLHYPSRFHSHHNRKAHPLHPSGRGAENLPRTQYDMEMNEAAYARFILAPVSHLNLLAQQDGTSNFYQKSHLTNPSQPAPSPLTCTINAQQCATKDLTHLTPYALQKSTAYFLPVYPSTVPRPSSFSLRAQHIKGACSRRAIFLLPARSPSVPLLPACFRMWFVRH
jgi:hypothetical protein